MHVYLIAILTLPTLAGAPMEGPTQPRALDLVGGTSLSFPTRFEYLAQEETPPDVEESSDGDPYSDNLHRRFSISLGLAAYSDFDTSIALESSTAIAAILDLEDSLDVDSCLQVARLDGHYSFSRAHRIDFSY